MAATLRHVAKEAGVSVSTVSRVLNDRPGISEATRSRVLQAARALGYSANMAAQSLATNSTRSIGVVRYRYSSELMGGQQTSEDDRGIGDALHKHGYHMLPKYVDHTQDRQHYQAILALVQERRVDGLILVGPQLESRYIVQLYSAGIPVVLLDNKLDETKIDCILGDNETGTYEVTRHLLAVKRPRCTVFLSGPTHWLSSRERYAGYARAVTEAGLEPHRVLMPDTTIETGQVAMRQALEALPGLDAVVGVNDATAWGAGRACREAGLKVPEDVALAGYDDTVWARLHEPPLTTVQAHFYEIGYQAATRLIDLIERGPSPPMCTRIAVEVVVRESCGSRLARRQV